MVKTLPMKKITADTHQKIYFFGLALLAIGMPLSVFLMSISQFILGANWLIEGNYKTKVKAFCSNRPALIISSILLMHLLGLMYTHDFDYAMKDIRIKVPLFVITFLVATTPSLNRKMFASLMVLFVAAVTIATFISTGVWWHIIPTKHKIADIRDISIFISHIRFSLMICLAFFITAYYLLQTTTSPPVKWLVFLISLWLVYFLFFLDALNGIASLLIVALFMIVTAIIKTPNPFIRILSSTMLVLTVIGATLYMRYLFKQFEFVQSNAKRPNLEYTLLGHAYVQDTTNHQVENQNLVGQNICWFELEQAWANRSAMSFYSYNKKGEELKYTLIRYLTSKGEAKDANAVYRLSNNEIKAIEQGIPNVKFLGKSRFTVRMLETIWEFTDALHGGNINGHSVVMRLEFWKAALSIIHSHPVLGVGTGDVKQAFEKQYDDMHSSLDPTHRLRAHNQFLSIAVAFGLIGLSWFLIALLYPMIKLNRTTNYFYVVFFIIAIVSFFTEDTLETQAGITFFTFFNAIFLFTDPDAMLASKAVDELPAH